MSDTVCIHHFVNPDPNQLTSFTENECHTDVVTYTLRASLCIPFRVDRHETQQLCHHICPHELMNATNIAQRFKTDERGEVSAKSCLFTNYCKMICKPEPSLDKS